MHQFLPLKLSVGTLPFVILEASRVTTASTRHTLYKYDIHVDFIRVSEVHFMLTTIQSKFTSGSRR